MSKIRKGDEIVVTTGKDRGRRGTVTAVLDTGKVVVEGINVVKKHQKPNPNAGVSGGIVEKEMPIQASNVRLWNPDAKKGERLGYKFIGEGATRKKVRVFKSSGEVVDR
jgi:large subunit ribosomal protein L24